MYGITQPVKLKKKLTRADWIGIIGGFGLAVIITNIFELGFLPATLTALIAYWVVKRAALLNVNDIRFSLGRDKKMLLLFFIAAIGALGIFSWRYYQAQTREVACLKQIEYRGTNTSYRISDGGNTRLFKTQAEAMNYCLKVMR